MSLSEDSGTAVAKGPVAVALAPGQRQLFLDDGIVESMAGVRRTLHELRKDHRNPLIVPDMPGEESGVVVYGSVIREADHRWRMWYLACRSNRGQGERIIRNHAMAYAESEDGIHWRKPLLGVEEVDGLPTNRVLGKSTHNDFLEANGIIHEPDDPQRAYKTVFHVVPCNESGIVDNPHRQYLTACSPDGIHWDQPKPIKTVPPTHPDVGHLVYDPVDNRYLMWARARYAPPEVRSRAPENWFGRAVSLLTSDDFENWEDHGVVMTPDLDDPPAADIYSMSGFRYGDIWIGLVQVYDMRPDRHTLEIQLACSRDGRHWTRLMDRKPILPVGDIGEWDRYNQSLATTPVRVGNELWVYYGGRTWRHSGYNGPDSGPFWSGIGVARLRLDGFVSLDASFAGGTVTTKPLALPSADLFLNVKSGYGSVRIEALSLDGAVIATARPIKTDRVRAGVDWVADNVPLAQQPVRLRFRLENAQLYSLWCE